MNLEIDPSLMNSLPGTQYCESAPGQDCVTHYNIQECYWAGRSPYSEIVIADSPAYGKMLFLDKELQSTEADEAIYHEHLVHPVMNAMAHVRHKTVLVVGGGEGATVREVLKWDRNQVSLVVWVDIDEGLVQLCRRHLAWAGDDVYNDTRVRAQYTDIRQWLMNHDHLFDVIILDLPDPDVDDLRNQSNTSSMDLYSRGFFELLKSRMREHGAIVTHTGALSPGSHGFEHIEGMKYIMDIGHEVLNCRGTPYHTVIPSFQGEWGFWMSVQPSRGSPWPQGLRLMDDATQMYATTWPSYWSLGRHQ